MQCLHYGNDCITITGAWRGEVLYTEQAADWITGLLGGDKRGDWKRWYKRNIPLADDLLDDYLSGR